MNAQNSMASVMLSGFSYHYIRDDRATSMMDRVVHLQKVLAFLGNTTDPPIAVGPSGYVYSLSQNRPNPFNPHTTIEFELGRASTIALRVFDVQGRLVRSLLRSRLPAGEHSVTWDGTNDAGASQPSGLYFYRLVGPDGVRERRMVLLR